MSSADANFAALMEAVRDGSDDAARELLNRYGRQLQRVIRRRMKRQLRTKYDSDDVAQAVWASFFAHRSLVMRFTRPAALIQFLARVTSNKLITETRRLTAQKRGPGIETANTRSGELICASPRPSEIAVSRETWRRLVEGLPDLHRRILELRAGNATQKEIAAEMGVSSRTVRRVLAKVLRRLDED